jgi:hypothetical protein
MKKTMPPMKKAPMPEKPAAKPATHHGSNLGKWLHPKKEKK